MASRQAQTPATRRHGHWLRISAAVLLFVFALGGMLFLQDRRLRQIQVYRPYVDTLFLPRVNMVRYMAVGYNLFFADFLYLRSIQAFGGQWRFGMKNYESITHLFNVITELDPHFIDAYEFGSMIIGEEANEPKEGMELLSRGWYKNTDHYRLAYLNAYTALWVLDDPLLAKFWILQARKAADAPDFVNRFVQYLDQKMGRYESALEKNVYDYLEALQAGKDYLRIILQRKFQLVCEDWNIDVLTTGVEKYREDHGGELPFDLQTLFAEGYIKDLRLCDYPKLKAITDNVSVSQSADINSMMQQIMKVCVGPATGIPHAPFAKEKGEDIYFIRVDIEPEEVDIAIKNKTLVVSGDGARKYLREQALPHIRRAIRQFHSDYKRYPFDLEELYPDKDNRIVDPLTGTWYYNWITGQVFSPAFPDL